MPKAGTVASGIFYLYWHNDSRNGWHSITGMGGTMAPGISMLRFAEKQYAFNFDLLFYDVTTLYFEAFEEDELCRNGFSKDNKSQQPQILVALLITKEGFPIVGFLQKIT